MKKFLSVRTAKVLILIIVVLLFMYGFLPEKNENKISKQTFIHPLLIKGFSSEVKDDNGELISNIAADMIKIRPRKFFVFSIKSVSEAFLTNVKADLFVLEKENEKENILTGHIANAVNALIKEQKGIGVVSRIIMEEVKINVHNSDIVTLKLKAKSAEVLKNKNVNFSNVILENPISNKLIKANKVIWDFQEATFRIPNMYLAVSSKGRAKGQGLKVDLNFNLYPL
jgi:hypothetical protein